MKFYYFSIFLLSFILSDLNAFPMFKIGGQNFYGTDFFFGVALIIMFWVVFKKRFLFRKSLILLNLFLASVCFAIFYGVIKFGFRAVGEGRMVYSFFYLAVPFFINEIYDLDYDKLISVINNTVIISGLAAFLMLMIEVINGGRFFFYSANIETLSGFEDFRGIRYLDAEANFSLNLLAFYFLCIALFRRRKIDLLYMGIFLALLIIIILIKNRSALASLMFAFALYFILQASLKKLLSVIVILALLIYALIHLLPSSVVNELAISYQGVFNITEDETGSWRMLVQLVAFNQALQTPLLGQGFGGYYDFYIPELDLSFDYPPHNIFVLLFLKGGIFSVLLSFIVLIYLTRKFYKLSAISYLDRRIKVLFVFFTVLCLSQFFYGMVYAFFQFFFLLTGFMLLLVRKVQNANKLNSLVNSVTILPS